MEVESVVFAPGSVWLIIARQKVLREIDQREMDKFFSEATKGKGKAPQEQKESEDAAPKKFPKGVVLGKDGKP